MSIFQNVLRGIRKKAVLFWGWLSDLRKLFTVARVYAGVLTLRRY